MVPLAHRRCPLRQLRSRRQGFGSCGCASTSARMAVWTAEEKLRHAAMEHTAMTRQPKAYRTIPVNGLQIRNCPESAGLAHPTSFR